MIQRPARRQEKALIVTFYDLAVALAEIHMFVKADVDRLHDIWMIGAPVPSSRVLQPKIYDPRVPQEHLGNFERRIVFPKKLAAWASDVLQRRGLPVTIEHTMKRARRKSKSWG